MLRNVNDLCSVLVTAADGPINAVRDRISDSRWPDAQVGLDHMREALMASPAQVVQSMPDRQREDVMYGHYGL